jgi:radical SAM protein with 4Fe4S-binding SPASM domain
VMIKLFDIWYHDPDIKIMVDPFCTIVGNIVSNVIHSCDFRRNCHAEIISVTPTGNVYPCGQFAGQNDYFLGNIYDESFDEIMESDNMKKLLMRVPENIERCSRCKYVEICNCGCTAGAVCKNGDILQPDFYCLGRKMLFRHIIDKIQEDIDKATRITDFVSKES